MKALTVVPGHPDQARLLDVDEPPEADGPVLVRTRLVGVCGTDVEIVKEGYGELPPGADRLVIGHESLGEVLEAPAGSGLAAGDLVVGIVRRPDPVPCSACAVGQWDMCRNGGFVERGIKAKDGYCSERYRITADFAVKVDPGLGDLGVLLEPTSVVAKAWEQVERISARAAWDGHVALVTGAGPIGLLAALLAVQRGYETHVLDVVADGLKPELVGQLGATYHHDGVHAVDIRPDVVIEATGVGQLVFDVLGIAAPDAIVALTGISAGSHAVEADLSAVNKALVLTNQVVFGSVNAARRHYEQAEAALVAADRGWLARLLTRRVPLASWPAALEKDPDDVKVTIDVAG